VSVTQLPMDIPAVAKWNEDVEEHMESPHHEEDNQEGCRGCIRLRNRIRYLRIIYADRLVKI